MNTTKFIFRLCAGLSFAGLFFAVSAPAQVAISGRITGFVTDASGSGIAGAAVNVAGTALMAERTSTSQSDGSFLFDQLPVGTYEVQVSMSGFKRLLQPNVEIKSGFTATLNLRLEVGEVSQNVTVEGAAPIVDVTSNQNATTFSTSLLQNTPSGRDVWSTVAQIPGATTTTFDVGGSRMYQQSNMQIHGSKPGEQVYSFNGLKLNWPGGNGGSTAFYLDHDAQEEFQVVTDGAPAEVSVGGMAMNMITRSGSDQWHGLAAVYYLTAATQSPTSLPTFKGLPVQVGLPFSMARDATANVGGALIKDKLWLFDAWRYYVVRQDVLAVRRKDGSPVVDNNHQTDLTSRLDYQINVKNRVSAIWMYNEQNRFFRRSTAYSFVADSASQRQIEPAYILQGQWTGTPTPNIAVEARFGYMKLHFPLDYQVGVKPTDLAYADTGLSTLSGAALNSTLDITGSTRLAVNGSIFKGAMLGTHTFKMGYEFDRSTKQDYTTINGDINVFLVNNVASRVDVFSTPLHAQSNFNESAAFLQDAWTVSRRLTVTVGGRFEHFRTYNPAQGSPASTNFSSIFTTRSYVQSQNIVNWNTIVPRIGLAWDPMGNGRSAVHAGYARFRLSEGTRLAEALNPNNSSGRQYRWTDTNADGIPQLGEYFAPANVIGSFGGIVTRVDPNLKRPYSDQINVGYERQILGDLRVGVSYYHRTTKKQISRINAASSPSDYTPKTVTNPLDGSNITIYALNAANVGKTDYLVTNIAALDDNTYNGVEFTAVKRLSNRWQILSGFTIQKASGTYGAALSDDFNNPNKDINRRNAILDNDATYVFKLSGTYQAPWHVSISPNYQYYTGYPILPTNTFTGLPQNTESVILLTRGTLRLPNVSVLNLRIARPTRFKEGRIGLEPIVDLLNIGNANPVLAETSTYGANYLKPSDLLNPFVARFAMRLTF